jgi:hypothetical protein
MQDELVGDFDVRSGCIAIGDPGMGLVHYALGFRAGHCRLQPGALRHDLDSDVPKISLDYPCLFVLDASMEMQFLNWFQQTFNECHYIIPSVVERLDEAHKVLGLGIGFYWEEQLSGVALEGTYQLDLSKIVMLE